MTCAYCGNTENITTFIDQTGQEPDISICQDCYDCGVEPRLSEMMEDAS